MARTTEKNRQGLLRATLLSLLLGAGSAAQLAQASGYIGLDGSSLNVENSLDEELSPGGLRVRFGMPVAPMFDVEFHLGGGQESQTLVADRFSAHYAGAFLKAYLPVGRRSAFYGLAGVSAVDFTQTINGREFSDERSGFSYGFGMETELSRHLDLSADYVRYIRDEGVFSELSSISLGLKLYF